MSQCRGKGVAIPCRSGARICFPACGQNEMVRLEQPFPAAGISHPHGHDPQGAARSVGHRNICRGVGHRNICQGVGHRNICRGVGHRNICRGVGHRNICRGVGHRNICRGVGHRNICRGVGHRDIWRGVGSGGLGRYEFQDLTAADHADTQSVEPGPECIYHIKCPL
jgi:hypothetical protein